MKSNVKKRESENEKRNSKIIEADGSEPIPVTAQDVGSRMIVLRNQPVLIDADVAELYGIQTKEVNQAVQL